MRTRKLACALMLLATAAVFALSAAASELRVHFMDIDRNDGILIECDGEAAFIDSGTHDYGVKAVGYMKSAGVEKLYTCRRSYRHSIQLRSLDDV